MFLIGSVPIQYSELESIIRRLNTGTYAACGVPLHPDTGGGYHQSHQGIITPQQHPHNRFHNHNCNHQQQVCIRCQEKLL